MEARKEQKQTVSIHVLIAKWYCALPDWKDVVCTGRIWTKVKLVC